MRREPSNQFPLGFDRQTDTVKSERIYKMISKCGKFKVMGFPVAHPTSTISGTTKSEICVQEPTATKTYPEEKAGIGKLGAGRP
jgi:hypothetical protein